MPLLVAALLGLAALIVVVYPLLGLERETADTAAANNGLAELAERERAAKDALRDVEFDHQLGNLDESDYRALRTRYERRAITALGARYRREQELDALIERQLDEMRASGIADDEPAPPRTAADAPNAPNAAVTPKRPATSGSPTRTTAMRRVPRRRRR